MSSSVRMILTVCLTAVRHVLGQTAPHWTAHRIDFENNGITTQTITLTLNTKGNIVLDDHFNERFLWGTGLLHVLLSFQTIPRAFEVHKFSARLEHGQQTPLRVHGYLTFLSLYRTANVTNTFHVMLFTRNVHESIELIFMISFVLILEETLIIVSADHSHVFTMAGYPQRGNPIFGLATERGETEPAKAKDGLPYTVLGYANGPGGKRINGTRQNLTGVETANKDYLQQATVWRGSETHAGDDVGALQ